MGSFVSSIKMALFAGIRKISSLFPADRSLWVYGAWDAKQFSDNSKYMFEYAIKEHPEIKSVWITKNRAVHDAMRNQGYPCFMRYSLKGMLYCLNAGAAFITSSEGSDISPLLNSDKTKIIQLFHGFGPKVIRVIDDNGNLVGKKEDIKRFSTYYWMASSPINAKTYSEGLCVDRSRFSITGFPRNDTFVTKPKSPVMSELKAKYPGMRFVIYMPTHRNYGKESVDIDDFKRIDAVLKENNIIMVYKPHFHELKNVLHIESSLSNIILAKDFELWADVYSYLHDFDLLVSDYSSISYDFLCTDKPIVLYVYDIEHYKKEDFGLCGYFTDMPLGPFCYTWDETLKAVIDLLENDDWRERREKLREYFNSFNDGKNCERVFNRVKQLLSK